MAQIQDEKAELLVAGQWLKQSIIPHLPQISNEQDEEEEEEEEDEKAANIEYSALNRFNRLLTAVENGEHEFLYEEQLSPVPLTGIAHIDHSYRCYCELAAEFYHQINKRDESPDADSASTDGVFDETTPLLHAATNRG